MILGPHANGGTAHVEEPDAPATGEIWTASGTDIWSKHIKHIHSISIKSFYYFYSILLGI
jgi:hypothetical protein